MHVVRYGFADTLRRDGVRDCEYPRWHPIPIYSPVYWSKIDEVFSDALCGRIGTRENPSPRGQSLAVHIRSLTRALALFESKKTEAEASDFLVHENTSPPRMHYMKGETPASLNSRSLGQLGSGGNILISRDDGWDLRDPEGWYRYRCCRPITTRELKMKRLRRLARGPRGGEAYPGIYQ